MRSGPFAAWVSAWLAGKASPDEVLLAVTGHDAPHRVRGVAASDDLVPLSRVLIEWRATAPAVRLVLPVPGDVRGLPGPAAFRRAAIEAGEALFGGGLGLVPNVQEHAPSSAPPTVVWQAYEVTEAAPDFYSVAEAQHELTAAVRETASALTATQLTGSMRDVRDALGRARWAGVRLNLPPGHPAGAVRLVAQAQRLRAVVALAQQDPTGGAVGAAGITARSEALRGLATAVRRALIAGYNAPATAQAAH